LKEKTDLSGKKKRKRSNLQSGGSSSRPKVSAMIIEMAADYIGSGKTLKERQNALSHVATAWNLALLTKEKRKMRLHQFKEFYMNLYPTTTEAEFQRVKEVLEKLIARKLKYFPNINRVIFNAELLVIDGKEHITVQSTEEKDLKASRRPTALSLPGLKP